MKATPLFKSINLFLICSLVFYSCTPSPIKESSETPNSPKEQKTQNEIEEGRAHLIFDLPKGWSEDGGTFIDTMAHQKVGELLPGLVTAKGHIISGAEFIQSFTDNSILEFKETDYTSMGMPFDLLEIDSLDLANGEWFYTLSDYGEEEGIFRYGYTYYGVRGSQSIILNFYHDSLGVLNTDKHKHLIGSIRIENP